VIAADGRTHWCAADNDGGGGVYDRYVNIDDCWMRCTKKDPDTGICQTPEDGRDSNGNIIADPELFPSGMKALGDYLHSLGLKFGLYTSSGNVTCQNYTGSWGHWEQDAQQVRRIPGASGVVCADDRGQFAAWGVDFLKLDCCYTDKAHKDISFPRMSDALNATGRPILFSCDTDELFANPILARLNDERPWTWGPAKCNMWRTGPDMRDQFFHVDLNGHLNSYWWDGTDITGFSGPGGWNDADFLAVGMGNETFAQYQTQLFLWAIQSAPLIAGNDIRSMSSDTLKLLTARGVLAIDQDTAKVGQRISQLATGGEVWVKPLSTGDVAVLFANFGLQPFSPCITWQQLGFDPSNTVRVNDAFLGISLGEYTASFCAPQPVAPSASLLLVFHLLL
jgi:alpha-galactosidase